MQPDYALKARVKLALSDEKGRVIARNESIDHPVQYYVRYVSAQGVQREDWFFSSALLPDMISDEN